MPDRPSSRDGILRPSSFGSRPGSRSSGALPPVSVCSISQLADTGRTRTVRPSSRGSVTIDDRPNSRGGVQGGGADDMAMWPPAPQSMGAPAGLQDERPASSGSSVGGSTPSLSVFVPSEEPLSPILPTSTAVAPSPAVSREPARPAPEPEPEPPAAAGEADMPVDLRRLLSASEAKGGQPREVAIPGIPGGADSPPSTGSRSSRTGGSARRGKSKSWAVHGSLTAQGIAGALQESRQVLITRNKAAEDVAAMWQPDLNNLPPKYESVRTEALRIFKTIDADGNGFVTKDELQAAMAERGVEMNSAEVGQLLQAAESDGDGMINCDEYVIMVLRAKKQKEELEKAEAEAALDPRLAKLKDKEKKLAEHWDMLGSDVQTYGEEQDGEQGLGSGLNGGGSFLKQNATWQNSLGDFAAFPLVFLKACCCPCVQFGLNGAEILEPECVACHADGNCCATHIVPPHRHGELCLPLAIGWLLCCPLVSTIAGGCARFRLRRQRGIGGNSCEDVAVHLCCCYCAIIQEGAELGHERVRRKAEARAQRHGKRGAQP